jgi:hypothetical protein
VLSYATGVTICGDNDSFGSVNARHGSLRFIRPFILLGLAFVGGVVIYDLKRRNVCSLSGLRTYRRNLVAMLGSMFVTYFVLYWVIEFLFITKIYPTAPPPPNDTLWAWDQVLYRILHSLGLL